MIPSVSATDAETLPRHRWYFFKEAFSPAVVQHAIEAENLGSGAVIFDPFSGSGTTPLVAGLSGCRGVGTEVNPFMRFVGKTKLLNCTKKRFDDLISTTAKGIDEGSTSPLNEFSTFSEKAEKAKARGKWLFNSSVLSAFEGGMQALREKNGVERNLVKLCLIGAAMDASNAAKDGKCLRYKKQWKNLAFDKDDFVSAFLARTTMVRDDIEATGPLKINADVHLGDSRVNPASEKFDLCVTSPPYLNSFDYTDVYRPELFLGGFVKNMEKLRDLRLATVRSHVQASWDLPTRSDFGTSYAEAMKALMRVASGDGATEKSLWDGRLPTMIQAYFEDMERVLKGLRRRSKVNGSVWLVVSTSAYVGIEFPVDLIIADIAGRCGWYLREVIVLRHLRRVAGQQWNDLSSRDGVQGPHLRESLVILDAAPKGG